MTPPVDKNILPIFRFCAAEHWFPIGVEESLYNFGYQWGPTSWYRKPGESIECLNFPPDMIHPNLPSVVYHRIVFGADFPWHQFWLWYLYNPWGIGGVGKHEGDWEMIQIGCDSDMKPFGLTYSQHHNGGRRDYWATELLKGRPVVYVALGSHANYFAPGRQGGGIDICDGEGLELANYELRDFGEWASWPGRWGNSSGEGKSPESPGCQSTRWKQPHLYHSNSK